MICNPFRNEAGKRGPRFLTACFVFWPPAWFQQSPLKNCRSEQYPLPSKLLSLAGGRGAATLLL